MAHSLNPFAGLVSVGWTISISTAALIVVVVGAWWLARGRSRGVPGTAGIVRENTVVCPKCRREFNYRFVPGASLTSLRLGRSRYMRCPLCGKWSVIRVVARLVMPPNRPLGTQEGR
jgi:hypothetical protein